MPSKDENIKAWTQFDWEKQGDEWSAAWGSTEHMWWGTIYPRILPYVPGDTILEIACGYGRCTQYLKRYCSRLVVIDIAENCVEACRQRFASDTHIEFHVTDGMSLPVADRSVDFVFSWDSLVHAERDVLEAYTSELGRVLTPGGWAFIHHSNLAQHLREGQEIDNPHWRGTSMSAELMRNFCAQAGLRCATQELIPWGISLTSDCFSLITREDSTRPDSDSDLIIENTEFMKEVERLALVCFRYRKERGSARG